MRGKAGYRLRRSEGQRLIIAIVVILLLMIGFTVISQPSITMTAPLSRPTIPDFRSKEDTV